MHGPHPSAIGDATLGTSADKPIDLDLDIDMNLFPHPGDGIPSGPLSLGEPTASVQIKQEDHQIALDFLNGFPEASGDTSATKDDILASLDSAGLAHPTDGSTDAAHDILSAMQPSAADSATPGMSHLGDNAASPNTILAGFAAAADLPQDASNPHTLPPGGENYEFDIGLLAQSMDTMSDLFDLETTNAEGSTTQPKQP
ncbi:hypothetical protein NM688_g4794 [Phlebia brevispora]|uniref:Uncharacterized protein n=1 Tax=Phlebia brevispora TaxID=194682 RepID=A0ACC1T236_9APHY|nr:hypothetical protein NM688_g4794 [Phlebia brevispora]